MCVLSPPARRSPSQWPGTARSSTSAGRALIELNRRAPAVFGSPDRRAYVVTNAWSEVEYPALTGRSVPGEAEVLMPANLARLLGEIESLQTIVACGAQAQAAVRALVGEGRRGAAVAYARHLSQRSVNMIPGGATTDERIARWVDQVLAQLPAGA